MKRILRRGFTRKQAHCLQTWFIEFLEAHPMILNNNVAERDPEALEAKLGEIKEAFFDWAEQNKTLNPKIWGDQ